MFFWRPHSNRFFEAALQKILVVLACFTMMSGQVSGAESSGGVSEYQVKAVFLYNFTQFTDWPASAFAATNTPLVIGIVGDDPFGKTIDEVVRGETVRGHPLVVKRLRADDDLRGVHILFISHSENGHLPALLKQLKGSPVLSVSEISGFCEQGGMVNLLMVNNTVKMEINQSVAEQAGLQISAKLLKLARIVLKPDK